MKIGIFIWRDIKNPQSGGSEIYFHEMAKRWVKKGHEVIWFSPMFKGAKKEEVIDGIKFLRQGNTVTVYFQSALKYLEKYKNKLDVIVDVENGFPFFSPYFSKDKKLLHIHHVHKDVWKREKSFPISSIGLFLETKLMPLAYKKVPVVTLANSSIEEIKNELSLKQKPFIVNPGVEFYKAKKFAKTKNPTILFMNRIKKYKGIQVLLDSIKELRKDKSISNLKVLIAGSGEALEEMKSYAKKHKIKEVEFLGRVSEEKKAELMQKAWVFINPSFKEGWSIVNMEANYFSTLVIGSDVTGIRDSIKNNETGLLFKNQDSKDLAEKIKFIIKNKRERDRMSKKAKAWSKKFSWDKKADEYLEVLKKVAKGQSDK